ncbi:MAG: ABC transporter permease [Planctomycetota bacterium]|jgi:ribose/xylose/arabinose/galactoside ABC-type transport system permease subunit|nr:ABC transporter permease [Planctomycetota bacterium]
MSAERMENGGGGVLKTFVWFWNKAGILVVFLLVCAILAVMTGGLFLRPENILNIVRQVSIHGVVAVGMTMVILFGLIDLSVGSIIAFSGILAAALQVKWMKGQNELWMFAVAVFVALAAGAAVGFFNGFVSTKAKIHPFIITLGTMSIFRGVTLLIGNARPITGMTPLFRRIGADEIKWDWLPFVIPYPVIIFLVCVAIAHFVLRKTSFGRSIYAIGGNPEAAYLSGIMVDRVKILTYTILGVLSSVSGLILTSRLNSGQMTAGQGYEMDIITGVVIGGTSMLGGEGSVLGTLLGVLLIGVIQNGMNLMGVQPYWQTIVKGGIIILAVLMDRLKRAFQTD